MSLQWFVSVLAGLLFAVPASAQTDFNDNGCPAAPMNVRWEVMRLPDRVVCRAMSNGGEELFALIISRSSPFRPERANRAEEGTIMGTRFIWYRSAGDGPHDLRREALIPIAEDKVIHVTVRAMNGDALARNQKLFETIPLQVYDE